MCRAVRENAQSGYVHGIVRSSLRDLIISLLLWHPSLPCRAMFRPTPGRVLDDSQESAEQGHLPSLRNAKVFRSVRVKRSPREIFLERDETRLSRSTRMPKADCIPSSRSVICSGVLALLSTSYAISTCDRRDLGDGFASCFSPWRSRRTARSCASRDASIAERIISRISSDMANSYCYGMIGVCDIAGQSVKHDLTDRPIFSDVECLKLKQKCINSRDCPSGTGPKPENDCVVVAPVWNNHGRIPFWEWENRGEDRSDKAARPVKRRAALSASARRCGKN